MDKEIWFVNGKQIEFLAVMVVPQSVLFKLETQHNVQWAKSNKDNYCLVEHICEGYIQFIRRIHEGSYNHIQDG